MINNKITPALRFSEFAEEWQSKKLGNVLSVGSGRDYKHLKSGDIPVYGTGGLMLYVNDYLYDGKSICIGRKGTIDRPQFLSGKFWTVDTLFYTYNYKDSIPEFIFNIFKNINWQKHNEASGVPSLSKTTIESIKINLPSKLEQQKIADFLTAVDNKISAIDKKVELLKEYKKGVMQKIFSQEIQFKDENNDPYSDWENKTLGDCVLSITNGLNANQNSCKCGYMVTRIETISNNHINLNKVGFIETTQKVDDYRLYVGDILFSNINSPSQIGRTVYIDKNYNLYHGMNLLRIQTNRLFNSPKYLFYVLSSIKFKQYFEKICNKAVNQASINQTDLKRTKVIMPSLREQQKISDFLTEFDGKICSTEQKLNQAKQFKKALLQRMFV